MSQEISDAFQLLFIGMVSVFIVLSLVVIAGKSVIYLANKYAKNTPIKRSKRTRPEKLAVIAAVVDHVTHGKGSIHNITKL